MHLIKMGTKENAREIDGHLCPQVAFRLTVGPDAGR